MQTALFTLLRLQARAALRRAAGALRSVKGALMAAVGLTMFLLWLVPTVAAAAYAPPVDRQLVVDFGPVALLALTAAAMLSAGEKAIAFTPAEVNFLFAGPFTRRQLLAYKLSKSAAGALAMAVVLSVATRRFSTFWPANFVGAVLALTLVNLCTTAGALISQSVAVRLYTPARRTAAALVPVLIAGAVILGVVRGRAFFAPAAEYLHAPAARLALAPFRPFVLAYAGKRLPDVLLWGGVAAAIDVALLAWVMRLDANYLEAAAEAGQRQYDLRQRLRAGGDWMPNVNVVGTRSAVPPFPWLGGAGPVAWRQLTTLVRRAPRLLFVLLMAATTMVPLLMLGRKLPTLQGALFPALGWTTFMLVGTLRFDFRGDLDQLPWLKSLPLRPLPLAAGQLIVPTAALALLHVVACAAIAAVLEPLRLTALAGMALALPLDLLLVAVENLTFLFFPSRPVPPTELGALGRQMLLFFLRMVVILVGAGVAALAGGLVYVLTRSWPGTIAAAALVLGAEGVALVPLIAIAYHRFDPGSDLPP